MARPTTAGRRYAEALFDLARRDKAEDRYADDLDLIAAVVADPAVGQMLDNPAIPYDQRESVLEKALAGSVAPTTFNVARLLAQRGRVELIAAVAREYRRLLNRQRGVVEAVVTSALPLAPDEAQAVRDQVVRMTGAKVELREELDESLIGGLTVQVGDRLLDASVRGRLERLRAQLVAGTRPR
jgi:F-type H+-transporting ATPase subunit delta